LPEYGIHADGSGVQIVHLLQLLGYLGPRVAARKVQQHNVGIVFHGLFSAVVLNVEVGVDKTESAQRLSYRVQKIGGESNQLDNNAQQTAEQHYAQCMPGVLFGSEYHIFFLKS
jgi:hypothetical protein